MGKNLAWLVLLLAVTAWLSRPDPRASEPTTLTPDGRPPRGELSPFHVEVTPLEEMAGMWALESEGQHLLLELTWEAGQWYGRLQNQVGFWEPVYQLTFHAGENPHGPWVLNFFLAERSWQHFRCQVSEGGLNGRIALGRDPAEADFRSEVKGYHPPPPGWVVGPPLPRIAP